LQSQGAPEAVILAMFHAEKQEKRLMAQPWRLFPVIGPFIPQKKLLATFDLANILQQKDFTAA
jgi:hypothetical protein